MPGLLRKSMLYLGLVDADDKYDGDDYVDDEDDYYAPRGAGTRPDPGPVRSPDGRLSDVRADDSAAPRVGRTATATAPETRQAERYAQEPSYRITTLCPRTYNEARQIGEEFRAGTPVIMNLTEMSDADAKRLVDFAAGLIFGLFGSIERVTNKVFLLSPRNVTVSAEDKARIAEGGFFNQS